MQNNNLPLPLSKDLNIDNWHKTSHYYKMSLFLQKCATNFPMKFKDTALSVESSIFYDVLPLLFY